MALKVEEPKALQMIVFRDILNLPDNFETIRVNGTQETKIILVRACIALLLSELISKKQRAKF